MERPDVTIDTSNFAQILSDWQGTLTITAKTKGWELYGHDRVIEFSEGTSYEVKYALERVLRELWRPAYLFMLQGDKFLESISLEKIEEVLAEKTGWNVEYSSETEAPDVDDDYPSSVEEMSDGEDSWVRTEKLELSVDDGELWLPDVFTTGRSPQPRTGQSS